ncbi:MAG: GAF domain-containing protein [Deltaproteobacteria bacterium]|nr:MAG: GAF domain-containing protein [Deltaproteobacteria bacterium]
MQARALLHIARAVSRHLERDRVFSAIATAVGEFVPHDKMALMMPNPDGEGNVLYALHGPHDPDRIYEGRVYPSGDHSVVDALIADPRPRVIGTRDDLGPFTVARTAFEEVGVHSAILLPLVARGRGIGVFCLMSDRPHAFADTDLEPLVDIADAIAIALFNSMQFEENARLRAQLAAENAVLRDVVRGDTARWELIGDSPAMQRVRALVDQVAPTDTTVLVTGETGTGKERVATRVWARSRRAGRVFVKVNCAALSAGLVESELFGHEKGAFTGAHADRAGRFEVADGGTIFLDEVGELPLETQAKLLRVLQSGEFERIGSSRTRTTDARIVAATNRDLEQLVADGRFRADLYYRLNVFPIAVPPLREHPEDIPALVDHILARVARSLGRPFDGVAPGAVDRLMRYDWPGNVRELQNVIERAAIVSRGPVLQIDDLGGQASAPRLRVAAGQTLVEVERAYIMQVLEECGWTVAGERGAAARLGLNPNTLRSRMQKLGIRRPERA